MGFCLSKPEVERGTPPPSGGTSKPNPLGNRLVETVEELGKQLRGEGKHNNRHHLRNIFVAPLEDIVGYVPPSYPKSATDDKMIRQALRTNFVFATLQGKDLDTIVGAFEEQKVSKGETIITQGDVGDYFYVIKTGMVEFQVDGKGVGSAKEGDAFGELALLYSAPRAASVTAVSAVELFRVDQKTFRKILQNSGQRAGEDRIELAKSVEYFKDLDEADLIKIGKIMKPRPFKVGDHLLQKGEKGEGLFIVQHGRLIAKDIEMGGTKLDDFSLGPGDNVGALVLAKDEPMPGNLIAVEPGLAMVIDKRTFKKTMGTYQTLNSRVIDKRVLGAVPLINKTNLDSVELSTLAARMVEKLYFKDEVIVQRGKSNIAALCFVREGSVKIHEPGQEDKIIDRGGFFGEDSLLADVEHGPDGDPVYHPKHSITALDHCKLRVLTLEECRTIFDTTRMGKGPSRESAFESKVRLEDLKKHKILGAGTFGQVWLVSSTDSKGKRHPFALKIQIKHELIENGQAGGVIREKNVMAKLRHPFIMKLVKTYQDPDRIYMLFGLLLGGELHGVFYERAYREGLPEKEAKFYMAGLLEGLSYMHSRQIIHRDLKPENVMINAKGFPVIIDFGFAKYVPDKTYTFCGTPLYIAPEVLLNRGHDRGADHWSVGCMIFESMTGESPFYMDGMDQLALFKAIVAGDFDFPRKPMSSAAKTIILDFLETNPSYRLGSLAGGLKDIYRHAWFSDIEWDALRRQKISAPWVPEVKNPLDNSNFSDWSHLKDKDKEHPPRLSPKNQALFDTF